MLQGKLLDGDVGLCYRVCYLMDVCVTGSPTVQGVGLCYLTHSFILRKEEAPICVACNVC